MHLRCGQSPGMFGNLLALFTLRQFGKMVEVGCGYGVSALDDEVHWVKKL